MPFIAADAKKHFSGLTRKESRVWAAVANSALKTCQDKPEGERPSIGCEGYAIATASGQINKRRKKAGETVSEMGEILTETPDGYDDISEYGGTSVDDGAWVPYGAFSFDEIDEVSNAREMQQRIDRLNRQYSQLLNNVTTNGDFVGDRLQRVRILTDQYIARLESLLGYEEVEPVESSGEPANGDIKLTESFSGDAHLVDLAEADVLRPLEMDVVLIRPGWGNTKTNFWYPRETIQSAAGLFAGAKMYETDHNPKEKSTRTWVSTIKEVRGYTDDGAPIGRVVVHDPDFAERVRNLDAAGLLSRMECSILANGKVGETFTDGERKGSKVAEITGVSSVDWVTKAGAGGHALNLSEVEAEGGTEMPQDNEEVNNGGSSSPAAPADEEQVVQTTEEEVEDVEQADAVESEVEELAVEERVSLSSEKKVAILSESGLPNAAIARLSEMDYSDEDGLFKAIDSERAYIKEVTHSGKVVGMGQTLRSDQTAASADNREKAIEEAAHRVNSKYFIGG